MTRTTMEIHPDVRQALAEKRPVVALESTIIAHGMPYPDNVEAARRVEEEVRREGAVPATIAVLSGRIRVGLDRDALERLGRGTGMAKLSRRDLPLALARRSDGATTVASTLIVAQRAGIEVFVTGGIGGVHRGAAETFDVSADLAELGRTNVTVVCAGAKSILDVGATLEILETLGVTVVGFGTDRFPAFYTRDSSFGVDARVDSPAELAAVVRARRDLELDGAVIVGNPIPAEHALDAASVDRWIRDALTEASHRGLAGKDVTPFLLSRIEEHSGGASLRANVELVVHNATVGARLAGELAASSRSERERR